MQKLFDFYENEVGRYKGERSALKKRMHLLSLWRIIVFTSTVLVVYLLRERTVWAILLAVAGTAIFLFLVRYYVDVKGKKNLTDVLLRINRTEIDVLNHRFDHLPDGREYMDPGHAYAHDLDLFGSGSFFQYINRTALGQGRNLLARLILANDIEAIPAKQETIDELAQMPGWRQDFTARAQLIKTHVGLTTIQKWLNGYTPFVPKLMRWLPWVFLGVSLILSALAFWFPQWGVMLIVWMGLGLMITGRSFKKISRLTSTSGKVQSTFGQYAKLLQIIETTDFASAQLRLQRQQLRVGGRSATAAIKRFSRLLDRMDYNNNVFYALFANGCFLGALQTAHALEQWINEHGSSVDVWFKTVAFFDAWNSLGNFAFNHPLYAYPIIQNGHTVLAATDAGHPIIPSEQNVHNDFEINDEEFLIVTGANMAGKSTFLRTVSLQIVMANMGLPVCASNCMYAPVKLITSMRSIDSLADGESYFFSELKRLKLIVDALGEERHFVVLDEILKGTNSADKALGSRQFLERLVACYATGIIATHDLGLCQAADDFDQVHNYFFDAGIQNGELYFDYRLRPGICQNMNASFLLKKMGVV